MAKAKKKAPARRRAAASEDAIALLKADHRQVEEWFEQFESTRSDERKKKLAGQICQALEVHTEIEEEIFYPAFLQATEEEDIHHEAEIEHDSAKKLIAEIEKSGPEDDYYDAKVKVLSEMIKHHVNEEEKRDGMFAKARKSDMDLKELGAQMAARKQELMGETGHKLAARRAREPGVLGRIAERIRGSR
jgi:hemerythrin HHE cation binding domain-containing protein